MGTASHSYYLEVCRNPRGGGGGADIKIKPVYLIQIIGGSEREPIY